MEILKKVAEKRLVVMVTHNPELAEQYSTRIVRLLDGNIIEDSNPVGEDEYNSLKTAENAAAEPEITDKKAKKSKEKAKMSVFTAFRLSAKNLISKKARTTMVGIAGSIGIIGIAMVLAFSAGIKGYIASMQDDMLSGNPITIQESALDLSTITGMMNRGQADNNDPKKPGNVYISSLVEYLIETSDTFDKMLVENELTEQYIEYVKAMPKEYYNDMILGFGLDFSKTIFTDFKETSASTARHISIKQLTDIYKSIISDTDYKDMARMVDMLAPNFEQAPSNIDYITSQYNSQRFLIGYILLIRR